MAEEHIADGAAISLVLSQVGLAKSVYYYRPKQGKRGRRPPGVTQKADGKLVPDREVIGEIAGLLSREFCCYGYKKVAYYLRGQGYLINKKKIYRLMKAEKLLLPKRRKAKGKRDFTQEAKVKPSGPCRILEMDIKYLYVHGEAKNAYLLTVLCTFSRKALGYRLGKSMRKRNVKGLLQEILSSSPQIEGVVLRCDNGSQFIAGMVRDYLKEMGVKQEFIHVGVPEENAHIESFHSILETEIERRFEFETFEDLEATIERYFIFYNSERIHSSIGYMPPNAFLANYYQGELEEKIEEVLQESDILVKI